MIEKKPNFFIVGGAKCGTTALNEYLRQHQEIYMPKTKEFHHFATDLLQSNDALLDEELYLSHFENVKNERIIGETSVFYLYSEEACKNIKKFNPNAKVIIMIRNPIDVAYSLHSQLVYNGEEDILDFSKALSVEDERKQGNKLPQKTRILKKHFYTEVVKYSAQIERYIHEYGENLKIIIFDDFIKNTEDVYREILEFLAVEDRDFKPLFKQINPNKVIKSKFLQNIYFKPNNRFKQITKLVLPSSKIRKKLINFLKQKNTKYKNREEMEEYDRELLIRSLKSDIDKIGILLKTDLSHWYNK